MKKSIWLWTVLICLALPLVAGDVRFYPYEGREMPFSKAVRAGNLVFLSGKLGTMPDTGKLAEGGVRAETRQALENIKATLKELGLTLKNVVKVTVMLADIDEFGEMNAVYMKYFQNPRPARSAFAAAALARGARVEIECIAMIPESE